MKIKRFEKYEIDQNHEISDEYAKLIISEYIDQQNEGATIEKVFADIIIGDDIEDQQDIIKASLLIFIGHLYKEAKEIRHIHEISADKYNL